MLHMCASARTHVLVLQHARRSGMLAVLPPAPTPSLSISPSPAGPIIGLAIPSRSTQETIAAPDQHVLSWHSWHRWAAGCRRTRILRAKEAEYYAPTSSHPLAGGSRVDAGLDPQSWRPDQTHGGVGLGLARDDRSRLVRSRREWRSHHPICRALCPA